MIGGSDPHVLVSVGSCRHEDARLGVPVRCRCPPHPHVGVVDQREPVRRRTGRVSSGRQAGFGVSGPGGRPEDVRVTVRSGEV